MSVTVKYKINGGFVDLASLRKQDFVSMIGRPFNSSKITWDVDDVKISNALQLIQTSQDCFRLQLSCDKFKLNKAKFTFDITLKYRGKVNRTINVCLLYPKEDAKYIITHKLHDIEWGKNVDCGFLNVSSSNSNIGNDWWQYTNIKNLYIKKSKYIFVNNASIVSHDGVECFVIPLKPRQSENIKIIYIGQGQSPEHPCSIDVEYGIDSWSKFTLKVNPLKQDFNITLHRRNKLISSFNSEEIYELIVSPTNDIAANINITDISCSGNECICINHKQTINGVSRYSVIFNPVKVAAFPLNLNPSITVYTSNCGNKTIQFSIISNVPKLESQVQFCPDSIFGISLDGNSYYPEEVLNGIGITITNKHNINIQGLTLKICDNSFLSFTSNDKNVLAKMSLGSNGTLIQQIHSSNVILPFLKGNIKITIDGSDYCQTFGLNIKIKSKHFNPPFVEIVNILEKDYSPNAILFECKVLNVVYKTDSVFSLSDLDVSKFTCSNAFIINPISSTENVRPGDEIILSVRLRENVSDGNILNFNLFYDNDVIKSTEVKFRQHTYIDNIEGERKPIIYPGQNRDSNISLGQLIFTENKIERQIDGAVVINLPLVLKKYRIEPENFRFENGKNEIKGTVGIFNFYLDVKLTWPSQPVNIYDPVDLHFTIYESCGDCEEIYVKETLKVLPISTSPIFECIYDGEYICENSTRNIDILYSASELSRKGHTKEIAVVKLSNVQQIPIPIETATVNASIVVQELDGKENLNLFSLNQCEFHLPNSTTEDLILIFDFQKFAEIKSTIEKNEPSFEVGISIDCNSSDSIFLVFKGRILEVIQGDWYSMDLGTTGIVIAKREEDGCIVPMPINEGIESEGKLLESDSSIISSIMGIHSKTGNNQNAEDFEILLETDQDSVEFAEFILPPAKFIVGQAKIPFASNFKGNWDSLYLFNSDNPQNVNPSTLISELYKSILGKIEQSGVRRLTLTYPNTYTGEQVSEIKNLVIQSLPNLSGRVNAVPESDAVVAHYLNLRRSNPLNKRKLRGHENILIYDMGAGTLDISFVEYQMNPISKKAVATISRKIGIPIAGNFLNLILFEILKSDLDLDTDIWKPARRRSTLEALKSSDVFASEKELNYAFKSSQDSGSNRKNSTDLIKDPTMELYLDYCCNKVFQVLFGDDNWKDKIDTIVFSGRASRFIPLRNKIKEIFGENADSKIDNSTIDDDELKKCVAIGAIQYTHAYSSENDKNRIQIVSHNQYYKLYAIYITHDEWNNSEVKCIQLIDPSIIDWENVEVKDGTKSVGLVSDEFNISLDPEGKSVQIVQSLLSQDQLENLYRHLWYSKSYREIIEDDCFVNEVANIPVTELGEDLENVKISIKVDINNNVDLRINGSRYSGEKIRETIEENRYYTVNETLMKI